MQIDVDPAEINKNVLVDGCVIGDVRGSPEAAAADAESEEKHPEWLQEIEADEGEISAGLS